MIGRIKIVKHRNIAFKKHAVTLKCVVWFGALDWKHSLSQKSRSHHHLSPYHWGFRTGRARGAVGGWGINLRNDFKSSSCETSAKISGFPKIVGFPPKSSILIGFSIINHPFSGYPLFLEIPIICFSSKKRLMNPMTRIAPSRILAQKRPPPGGRHDLHVLGHFGDQGTKPPAVTRFRIPEGYDFYTPET